MIRFALIVASTLGFVLTAALGNFMAPLLQELERFRPQEQQEPQTPTPHFMYRWRENSVLWAIPISSTFASTARIITSGPQTAIRS